MKKPTSEWVKIETVIPYENNPRLNDNAVDYVANSIREFGFKNPIIVDKHNVIIAGHTRLKASQKLGLKEVPIIRATELTDEQVKAFRLADNKTAELASWDFDMMDSELGTLDIDMSMFGFEMDGGTPAAEIEVEEDEVSEVPNRTDIAFGDIFQLGNHRLMCGDSTNEECIDRLMNGTKAEISFTSPPYNADHLDISLSESRGGGTQKATQKKYLADNDKRTDDEYFEFLRQNVYLLLNYSDEVFYNIGVASGIKKTITRLLDHFSDKFKDLLYWQKINPMPVIVERVISSETELIIALGNNNSRAFNHFNDRMFHGVIRGKSASSTNEYADIHKATFPVYLPAEIISRFTTSNGTVLDCFGGTGTTMIACEQLDRRCFMMELEPIYCDVIVKRWEKFTGQKAVKLNG